MNEANIKRSEEEIRKFRELAKLDESELKALVQPIFYTEKQSDELVLLEVDADMLDRVCKGKSLVFKGSEEEPAVICTDGETFEVREAGISNSLLLFKDLTLGEKSDVQEQSIRCANVLKTFHTYIELRPCFPRIKKLYHLLQENPYRGKEHEEENCGSKYSMAFLLDMIQCSEKELENGLGDLPVCLIDDHLRFLEPEYHFRVLNFILNSIDSNSFSFNDVKRDVVIGEVSELEPEEIVETVFSWYVRDEIDHYELNVDKVCRFIGEILLIQAGRFNLKEFLDVWQKSVLDEMVTNLKQLAGIALTEITSRSEVISYFPAWNLPEEAKERFNALFKAKEKWTLEEIQPYVQDLCSKKETVNSLLMKNARSSTENGVRVYTPKRPIY